MKGHGDSKNLEKLKRNKEERWANDKPSGKHASLEGSGSISSSENWRRKGSNYHLKACIIELFLQPFSLMKLISINSL